MPSPQLEMYSPRDLDRAEWGHLQAIHRAALQASLNRSPAEIDRHLFWGEPTLYMLLHDDPDAAGAHSSTDGFEHLRPRVVVAKEHNSPVGFAYAADAITGSSEIGRNVQKLTAFRNYLWLGEVVVAPTYQHRGVAKAMVKHVLEDAVWTQPVIANVWPDEDKGVAQNILERYGFQEDPEAERIIPAFSIDNEPVRQVRMKAPMVRPIINQLRD